MFATMPQTPPTFTFGRPGQGHTHHTYTTHRPAYSSPLSSSPIRASSVSPTHNQQQTNPTPLSPCSPNQLNALPWQQRDTQSSPISAAPSLFFGSSTNTTPENSSTPKFRFASRNPRPNPVLKKREDAQEGRRRLFFASVRQRQDDRRWEMRGGEDELHRLEWNRLAHERQLASEAATAGLLSGTADADMIAREEEELLQQQQQLLLQQQQQQMQHVQGRWGASEEEDVDALMADAMARQEAEEVDALVAGLEGGQFSDDEDYDELFMDLVQSQEQQQGGGLDVEMS